MHAIFYILLFILGASIGSFLCCQVRRFYLSFASKGKRVKLGKRSVCMKCNYQLRWYDNIPILSWLFLRGKCRKCKKKIGIAEILSEVGMGLAFLMIGTTVNIDSETVLGWVIFGAVLFFVSILGFLAIHDGMYGKLPMLFLTISIICAIIILILKEWSSLLVSSFSFESIFNPIAAVGILGGLYLALYIVSRGKWVGDGDWILGTAIGLALGSPWLAVITLFVSNVLACLVMAPAVKKSKNKKIYFGPFMVIAFVVVYTFADFFYYAIGM